MMEVPFFMKPFHGRQHDYHNLTANEIQYFLGVLLNQAQNVKAVALHPWMLIPATFVIVTVLAFNLLGDGLRDAADPYAS